MRILIFVFPLALWAACSGASSSAPKGPVPEAAAPEASQGLPDELRDLEIPPAPVLAPDEALAAFRVAPGFRVELVAAEPLLEDPVAIDWDPQGRLYAVEMRGYMPDIDGTGEDAPTGRVVVLEDADGDGTMDRSHVFLDGLVLPRAVAVLPQGVLIGAPPNLWLCDDRDLDLRCGEGERERVGDYAVSAKNPEYGENGLLTALDNWIYNAASERRFRWEGRSLRFERSIPRGQWGIDQDDWGRLYYNNNSQFAAVDLFPGDALRRHPETDPAHAEAVGVGHDLAPDAAWYPSRVTPGVNRAYMPGQLRPDGRLLRPTAVSGLAIYRGDQFGPGYSGDLFVPDVAVNAVGHFRLAGTGLEVRAEHQTYPDPDWGEGEFLASSDERFRPVDVEVGPDGALYVIDMYRGIIQHIAYQTPYLRRHIQALGLAEPLGLGRIWRVVREDRPPGRTGPDLRRADSRGRVAALSHPNGYWRDAAQRWLVASGDPAAAALLREQGSASARTRVHALFALEGLNALDAATFRRAAADPSPEVRAAALQAATGRVASGAIGLVDLELLSDDPDPRVRLLRLLALGDVPPGASPEGADVAVAALLDALEPDLEDPRFRQAALSGLAGRERAALLGSLARADGVPESPGRVAWLQSLSRAGFFALRRSDASEAEQAARLSELLAEIESLSDEEGVVWQKRALLAGLAEADRRSDLPPALLAARPALFSEQHLEQDGPLRGVLRAARALVTWPGDPNVPGTIPLTADQRARRERGRELYTACGGCHQPNGRGLPGLAPSLVGSPWVLDAEDWLIRIALQGMVGPVEVHGEIWDGAMPGHAADPHLDDEGLAGLLTYVRLAWGNKGAPIDPEAVARVRAQTSGRAAAWRAAELHALPVEHRFDRFAGRYRVMVGIFPITIRIERDKSHLVFKAPGEGSSLATLEDDGRFHVAHDRENVTFHFEDGSDGQVETLVLDRDGTRIEFQKVR